MPAAHRPACKLGWAAAWLLVDTGKLLMLDKEHSLCDMAASAQPGSATNCSDAVGMEVGWSWHFSRPQLSRLFNGLGEMTSMISSRLKLCDQCQKQGGSHGTRRTGLRSLCCPGVGFRFFGITGLLCQDKTDGWKLPGLTYSEARWGHSQDFGSQRSSGLGWQSPAHWFSFLSSHPRCTLS